MNSIFDKVTLNNGYQMPPLSVCPDMPDSDDLAVWQKKHPDEIPFEKNIEYLLECGYRSFDSGMRYGTEEILGKYFRNYGIAREELFLTTKVYHNHHGYENTLRYVDSVLKKTGLDYIDLFLIHCPVTYRGLYAETFKALTELYGQGVIKVAGVSNFTVQHFYDLAEVTDIVPAVNQYEQHPFYVQHNLLAYERKHGIIPQSYSPLGHGKYACDKRIKWIADKYGKTVAQVILRWHLQSGFMAVTRSSNDRRIAENADIFDFELSKEDMAYMETMNRGVRIWHDPIRFPGSYYYEPVEQVFLNAVSRKMNEYILPEDVESRVWESLNEALSFADIDGTKDYVIYSFTSAVAKYGRNANLPAQAEKEACEIAAELVERTIEQEKGVER